MAKPKTTPAIIAGIIVILLLVLGLIYWIFRAETLPESPEVNVNQPENTGELPTNAASTETPEAEPTETVTTTTVEPATNGNTNRNTNEAAAAKPKAQEKAEATGLEQYDQMVLVFTSGDGKVNGTAGLSYDSYSKKLDAVYNFYLIDGVAKSGGSYYYVGSLEKPSGPGAIDPSFFNARYCDIDAVGNPFGHYYEDAYRCGKFGDTDHFFVTFAAEFDSYEQIADYQTLRLYPVSTYSGDPAAGVTGSAAYSYQLTSDESSKADYMDHRYMQR